MAEDVGITTKVDFDLADAKSKWDEFLTYTRQHQPKANVESPSSPGSRALATTFGGLSAIVAPGQSVGAPGWAPWMGSGSYGAVPPANNQQTNNQSAGGNIFNNYVTVNNYGGAGGGGIGGDSTTNNMLGGGSGGTNRMQPQQQNRDLVSTLAKGGVAWGAVHWASANLSAQNRLDIGMAGASTADQMMQVQAANIHSGLRSIPIIGESLASTAEAKDHQERDAAGRIAGMGLGNQTAQINTQKEGEYHDFMGNRAMRAGSIIGSPSMTQAGIQTSADQEIKKLQANLTLATRPINQAMEAALPGLSTAKDFDRYLPGSNLSGPQTDNLHELQRQRGGLTAGEQNQEQYTRQNANYDVGQSKYQFGMESLGIGYDIDARNRNADATRQELSSPRTASAMREITSDRLGVQSFNLSHPGDDYAGLRQQNTQSYINQQQASFTQLQQMGQTPGNAQQVSGETFFGDFTNTKYADYSKALGVSGGGGAEIQKASDDSNKSAGDATQQILQVLQQLIPMIGAMIGTGAQ